MVGVALSCDLNYNSALLQYWLHDDVFVDGDDDDAVTRTMAMTMLVVTVMMMVAVVTGAMTLRDDYRDECQ